MFAVLAVSGDPAGVSFQPRNCEENALVTHPIDLVKPIHVQLAHKTGKLGFSVCVSDARTFALFSKFASHCCA